MEQAKGETEETKVDSSELQMIHDNISRKIRQIELGITFSTSARKLLQSLEESEDVEFFQYDLVNLAIGTIYYSLIRGVDTVAIVSMYDFDLSKATDTCVLPNMVICPPKTKSYNHLISGTSIIFPPESLLVDASFHCQIRQSTSYDELCKPQDGSMLHHGEIVGSIGPVKLLEEINAARDTPDYTGRRKASAVPAENPVQLSRTGIVSPSGPSPKATFSTFGSSSATTITVGEYTSPPTACGWWTGCRF
jgi:hypothetical protein